MNDYAITNISNRISTVLWTPVKVAISFKLHIFDFEIFLDV